MKDDPELQEIFTDPAHQEVVDLLRSARPKTPPLDPNYRSYLRAKLMTEARRTLPRRAARPGFFSRLGPRTLAPAMAAVAAGFIVVLGIEIYLHNQTPQVANNAVVPHIQQIDNKTEVATGEPIQIPFSGPVDKNAIAESVVIEPATSVTKEWVGSTLVIIPDHALAPNTNYTVSFKPQAVAPTPAPSASTAPTGAKPTPTAAPTVAPTPVVVHFTTARAAVPPVVTPSFKSANVTYVHDNRLADAGTILDATWTAKGQILATRPSGQTGPTPSATATSTGTAPARATTDVWLLSARGVALRQLAVNATMPSAPASGDLFAAWSLNGSQATLDVRDLQGALIATVATIDGTPSQPAVWLAADRLAYVDNAAVKVVDLHGTPITLPRTLRVDHGSIAASPNGNLLAVQTVNGSVVIDLGASSTSPLHQGATGFDWSSKGNLAFVVQQDSGTDLYVAADGKNATKVASSPSGQVWSDLNWAPDASSILLATRPAGSSSTNTGLVLIDSDGSHSTTFGAPQNEYATPEWSPSGDLVLFTRRDDATGKIAFWTASASTSGANAAEEQALAEVQTFIQARMRGDAAAAQAELSDSASAAYSSGTSSLVSSSGTKFNRYYPVTVQLIGTNPNKFLIGVRIFIAKQGGSETSFFEEQLTLVQQDQRYVIDSVTATLITQLSHGPSVLSYQLGQEPPGVQVLVHFDADLNPDTVNQDTIQIKTSDGQLIPAKVSFNADQHLATVSVKLKEGTYQLVVTTAVTDIYGTALAQEYDAQLIISHQG